MRQPTVKELCVRAPSASRVACTRPRGGVGTRTKRTNAQPRNVLSKLDIPDTQNGHRRVLAVVAYVSEMHKA